MSQKPFDLNLNHLPPADRIDAHSRNAQWELAAVETLLDSLWSELTASERMHGVTLTDTLNFSSITHLVTQARIRAEKITEAGEERDRANVRVVGE